MSILGVTLREQGEPPTHPEKIKDPKVEATRVEFKRRFGYKPVGLTVEQMRQRLDGPSQAQSKMPEEKPLIPGARMARPRGRPPKKIVGGPQPPRGG